MTNERRKLKCATDKDGKQKYRRLTNEIIRKSKRHKDVYLNDMPDEINTEVDTINFDKPE